MNDRTRPTRSGAGPKPRALLSRRALPVGVIPALLFASLLPAPSWAQSAAVTQDARLDARVAHAQEFASNTLIKLLRNNNVIFRWIGTGDSFWFRKEADDGSASYVLVDAATGHQSPLFATDALTKALSGTPDAASAGTMTVLSVVADGKSMVVKSVAGVSYRCDLPVSACTALPPPTEAAVESPDGMKEAFVRDHNLWVRDLRSGAERQLTTEGIEHFAYGEGHNQSDFARIARRRAKLPDPLSGVIWSPDSHHIAAVRYDLRQTPERLIVTEYLPPEGGYPIPYTDRVAIGGDARYPDTALDIIDVERGTATRSDIDPQSFHDVAQYAVMNGGAYWPKDDLAVYFVTSRRGGNEARLVRVDLASGRATDQIVEKSRYQYNINPTMANRPNVWVSPSGKEAIWYSERSGYGHLYLYDLKTGKVRRQITSGDWVVADLLRVDPKSRTLYFVGVGREAGRNPYYRHLYRVGLDGGQPTLLTPENAEHAFNNQSFTETAGGSISPDGTHVIDVYSTVRQPDKAVLRTIDGRVVAPIVEGDASRLIAKGWRPPEEFTVKADDGKTDLYGVMIKPINFDPKLKYPVIDVSYPGPFSRFNAVSFADTFLASSTLNGHAFAEAGAVVVGVEGRGGAYRSAAFRNAFQYTDDPLGGADHVAAVRNLAATRSYMDLDRVGATGHSNGGFSTLNAMLRYPDFYKVVVSGEGPGDWLLMQQETSTERILGVPTDPETLARYKRTSNVYLADRLKGKLLLILAAEDENVPFFSGLQMIAALQKANKVFDTLIMPQSPHYGGRFPYGVMRTIRYFAENLGEPK